MKERLFPRVYRWFHCFQGGNRRFNWAGGFGTFAWRGGKPLREFSFYAGSMGTLIEISIRLWRPWLLIHIDWPVTFRQWAGNRYGRRLEQQRQRRRTKPNPMSRAAGILLLEKLLRSL